MTAFIADVARAQPPPSDEALRQASQNPVANLISVPFQNTLNFIERPRSATQWILNIQPVIPFQLGNDWNLITRTIVPLVLQPAAVTGSDSEYGLGDTTVSAFFSPRSASGFIWGLGPIAQIPTSTDRVLGNGQLGLGITGVALVTPGSFVIGALASNVWGLTERDDRSDLDLFTIQPFVNYNLPQGWFLVTAPIITADWTQAGRNQWTVPIGGGFGRVYRIGSQPINASAQLYYNVVRPDDLPSALWSLRLQVQLLFPR